MEKPPEHLTLEAIERDPLNAVRLPLPDDATSELLQAVHTQAMEWPDDRAALDRAAHAALRLSDLGYERDPSGAWVDDMAGREAEPEHLTLEAIERDPLNAVRLPLPDDADRALLTRTHEVAADLADHWRERAADIREHDEKLTDMMVADVLDLDAENAGLRVALDRLKG